jgi:hypothetical protein
MTPEQVIAGAMLHALEDWIVAEGNHPQSVWAPDVSNSISTALRAAGLLPGPDDIVVSREALQDLLDFSDPATQVEAARSRLYPTRTRAILRAALSQPHPAQEQQT